MSLNYFPIFNPLFWRKKNSFRIERSHRKLPLFPYRVFSSKTVSSDDDTDDHVNFSETPRVIHCPIPNTSPYLVLFISHKSSSSSQKERYRYGKKLNNPLSYSIWFDIWSGLKYKKKFICLHLRVGLHPIHFIFLTILTPLLVLLKCDEKKKCYFTWHLWRRERYFWDISTRGDIPWVIFQTVQGLSKSAEQSIFICRLYWVTTRLSALLCKLEIPVPSERFHKLKATQYYFSKVFFRDNYYKKN